MAEKENRKTSFFVAKCGNILSLKKCIDSGIWACRDRTNSTEQPQIILSKAFKEGQVVLLFSVNNCHGWHGYCTMIDQPGSYKRTESEKDDQPTFKDQGEITQWQNFHVEWKCSYLKEFGERCVPFTSTDFVLPDDTHINKSRNWQEVPCGIGETMCDIMTKYYTDLTEKRQKMKDDKIAQHPQPFIESETVKIDNVKEYWERIVKKVEHDLGKVHLACPFGSQRYNLDGPESDIDVFVVYQAHTSAILGFKPPKQTIKNTEEERCDYTILEIHRYCELLASGDPRCVETLYLDDSTVIHSSPQWRQLTRLAHLTLTRQCLDKYLRDAQGSKGMKQLNRWLDENKETPLPSRIYKLCYIIIRLLQNARDVVNKGPIKVFRNEGSEERDILISVRRCELSKEQVLDIIKSLLEEIDKKKDMMSTDNPHQVVEQWLLEQRYADFKENHQI